MASHRVLKHSLEPCADLGSQFDVELAPTLLPLVRRACIEDDEVYAAQARALEWLRPRDLGLPERFWLEGVDDGASSDEDIVDQRDDSDESSEDEEDWPDDRDWRPRKRKEIREDGLVKEGDIGLRE